MMARAGGNGACTLLAPKRLSPQGASRGRRGSSWRSASAQHAAPARRPSTPPACAAPRPCTRDASHKPRQVLAHPRRGNSFQRRALCDSPCAAAGGGWLGEAGSARGGRLGRAGASARLVSQGPSAPAARKQMTHVVFHLHIRPPPSNCVIRGGTLCAISRPKALTASRAKRSRRRSCLVRIN